MIEVDTYQPQDFEELLALYRNRQAYGGSYDPGRDEARRLQATAEASNLYVAREAGKVVGSIMILDNPHTFWLLRFVVDPERLDQQVIAAVLWGKADQLADERGHKHAIVYTDPEDEALNQRYNELGFHRSGNYRCYWKEAGV